MPNNGNSAEKATKCLNEALFLKKETRGRVFAKKAQKSVRRSGGRLKIL